MICVLIISIYRKGKMSGLGIVGNLLSERSNFIVIGLTGRTGSGCTTTASILGEEKPSFPTELEVNIGKESFFKGLDKKRYKNVLQFTNKNYHKFTPIKVSDLITAYLLGLSTQELTYFIKDCSSDTISEEDIKKIFKNKLYIKAIDKKYILDKFLNHEEKSELDKKEFDDFFMYMELIKRFTLYFKVFLNELDSKLYIKLYQAAGNSIRKNGKVTSLDNAGVNERALYHLPETINRVIKAIRKIQTDKGDPCYVVIDAIRNPYEAKFFKDRYSAFYLVSINAPNEDRAKYLQEIHKFTVDQLYELEVRESGKDDEFIGQNVSRCIEISDIHIYNPRKEKDNNNILKAQLAWYISLMQHPGLVTPTAMERVMQMAFTAKMNSGCISRQVGAAITDEDYSIKAIGWNDVPKGQVPCNLRSLDGVQNSFNHVDYSDYERGNAEFREVVRIQLESMMPIKEKTGRNLAYCFKDVHNEADGNKKNQVHTRSLHAEENAFLQLVKYGGMAIKGGKLFTTASPCELCSKKAYQLGIQDIIFIDPYPGIAIDHILSIGNQKPNLIQFRGAIGKGYHQLYEPLMPYKDELKALSKYDV